MEYVDGEGAAASRDAIGTHLASCAACQAIAAEQRAISEHAQAWTVGSAPASLRPPVDARAGVLTPQVPLWRRSAFVLTGLTAAAAVLILVSFTARQQKARVSPALAVDALTSRDREASPAVPPARSAGSADGAASIAGPPQFQEQSSSIMQAPDRGTRQGTPSIIRTALLRIVAKDFSGVRSAVEGLVIQAGGFIDQMTVTGDTSTARTLRGTLRVPGDRLPDTLARLRQLGQVVEDTQGSQDVTDQIVDLDARLGSARATEKRLAELLANRTGRLSDVLEVERELARVRLEIERLDAEKANVGRRVSYATIDVTISEERKASLDGPLSLATRIRIAAADGLEAALDFVAAALLFVLRAGPTLLLVSLAAATVWWFGRRMLRPSA